MAIAAVHVLGFDPLGWRAPALGDRSGGDDQVYAAAELVRLGLATRVTLVNATVDPALPDAWEVRGTPVELQRLADDRARMTAGPRRR
jgi:hypothetical protein